MALTLKTTGLTPTEYANEEATRWNRVIQLQTANHDGVRSVRDKYQAEKAVHEMLKE